MRRVEKIKCYMHIILFFCLTFMALSFVNNVFEDKESEGRLQAFFEEKNDIDVLLFGTSHVRHGIFPAELFRDYGIISYNLAGNGDTIPLSYWKLKMALRHKVPKLIVMDIYNLWPGFKTSANGIGQVHTSVDAYPLSLTKIEMGLDLFEDIRSRMEIVFKYPAYHTRWKEFKNLKTNYDSSLCKGALPLNRFTERAILDEDVPDDQLFFDQMSYDYLNRMVDLCDRYDIEVLLINTGYDVNNNIKMFSDSMDEFAAERNLRYIDFTKQDTIDFNTDLQSTGLNTHVNCSGARKLTHYIGSYLKEFYHISDHRENPEYADWHDNYSEYCSFKYSSIMDTDNIFSELLMLSDPDFSMLLFIKPCSEVYDNYRILNLINNIPVYQSLKEFNQENMKEKSYFLSIDNVLRQCCEITDAQNLVEDTSFGKMSYERLPDGIKLQVGDKEFMIADNHQDIWICIIKNTDKGQENVGVIQWKVNSEGEIVRIS